MPLLTLLICQGASSGAFAPPVALLTPAWTVEHTAVPESVALAPELERLVAIEASGRVEIRNTRDGRLLTVVQLLPGARFAGAAGGAIFLYDRQRVEALLADAGQSLWRAGGQAAARVPQDDGDPEHLRRIVQAIACDAGVLLLDSKGAYALLDRTAGAPLWRASLPGDGGAARLHAHGPLAAVEWKQGLRTAMLLFQTLDGPRVAAQDVGAAGPIWSGLVAGGAVVIADRQAVMLAADGQLRRERLPFLVGRRHVVADAQAGRVWLLPPGGAPVALQVGAADSAALGAVEAPARSDALLGWELAGGWPLLVYPHEWQWHARGTSKRGRLGLPGAAALDTVLGMHRAGEVTYVLVGAGRGRYLGRFADAQLTWRGLGEASGEDALRVAWSDERLIIADSERMDCWVLGASD